MLCVCRTLDEHVAKADRLVEEKERELEEKEAERDRTMNECETMKVEVLESQLASNIP